MTYTPPIEILEKYADVMVNFAPNDCTGVKPGQVVSIQIPECAKPFLVPLRNAVLKAGAHPLIQYLPDDITREFFELANDEQLTFFPDKALKGRLEQTDVSIAIIADSNKHELDGIDSAKLFKRQAVFAPYMKWRTEKENAGKFFWTLCLYGTPAMAKEVGLSEEEYWNQIIKACYLDHEDPVAKWNETIHRMEDIRHKLNDLHIQKVHIEAENTDLWVQLGDDRQWLGGRGCNIPSFELFISPDWRGTNGHIQFTEKLYRYGKSVEGVYLEFKDGLVTKVDAKQGKEFIEEMIKNKNANKIGEFSLTDADFSNITQFMGETLFDENVGGQYGNTHLALGKAYQDSFPGDIPSVTHEQWEEMGYNDSTEHTDIVATSNRKVTAILKDGSEKVIYENGHFTV